MYRLIEQEKNLTIFSSQWERKNLLGKKRKVDSKEIGLGIALIFGKYLLRTEHLHYGYWSDGVEVHYLNLSDAQEKYCEFLASKIPEGTKTILDVGCGAGSFALKLISLGYEVDCVSPPGLLTERAREVLEGKSSVTISGFEEFSTDKRYDLVLFSESFQYVKIKQALKKCLDLLNKDGHILICDFFRRANTPKGLLGGGHKIELFEKAISKFPLENLIDIDITEHTAPNIDIYNDFLIKVAKPLMELLLYYLEYNRPLMHRIINWKFSRIFDKVSVKYFSNDRNSDEFKTHKIYKCLLYRRT